MGDMHYDIITFGSAALDLFLKTDNFLIEGNEKFRAGKAICFPFAEKVDIKGITFASGGGGTNTGATFSLQGFKAAFCGAVGNDFAGDKVLRELEALGIDSCFVQKTKVRATNLSVIFSQAQERTCFVWRGASEYLLWEKVDKDVLKADWFYLAPLSGNLSKGFEDIVKFAKQNNIRVFANLGNSQIGIEKEKLTSILKHIDILLLNQEEAALLTGISYKKEKKVFEKLDKLVPGLAIMTKGKDGAVASDGKYLWEVEALKVKVIEKTGAGDAFGSGFLTGYIKEKSIERGLQIGIANAASCIQKLGAKNGLLQRGEAFKKIKVIKRAL